MLNQRFVGRLLAHIHDLCTRIPVKLVENMKTKIKSCKSIPILKLADSQNFQQNIFSGFAFEEFRAEFQNQVIQCKHAFQIGQVSLVHHPRELEA